MPLKITQQRYKYPKEKLISYDNDVFDLCVCTLENITTINY